MAYASNTSTFQTYRRICCKFRATFTFNEVLDQPGIESEDLFKNQTKIIKLKSHPMWTTSKFTKVHRVRKDDKDRAWGEPLGTLMIQGAIDELLKESRDIH